VYRFFFFSNEHEPIHVDIEKGDKYAKIDVVSLKIEDSYKLTSKECKELLKIVEAHRDEIMEVWNEYLGIHFPVIDEDISLKGIIEDFYPHD